MQFYIPISVTFSSWLQALARLSVALAGSADLNGWGEYVTQMQRSGAVGQGTFLAQIIHRFSHIFVPQV